MKKTIKGVLCDTSTATPICCTEYSCDGKCVQETAYRTMGGQYFVVQTVNKKDNAIFLMSNDDMADWTKFHDQRSDRVWPGPQK